MAIFSLSTMWSRGRFKRLSDFADTVTRLGYQAIEINYIIEATGVEELLASNLTISSIHSPCPRSRMDNGRWSEELNLASLDEEERQLAVKRGCLSLDLAAQAGTNLAVFHLGGIGNKIFGPERELLHLFDKGIHAGNEVEALRRQCAELRAEGAEHYFSKAQRSLHDLTDHAKRVGVIIGLENRFHYHEIPSLDELHILLNEFPSDLVGYWHDMGHAEVFDRLGLTSNQRWLNELGERCVGSHLHDVDGITDHRAPGLGNADWDHIAKKLPAKVPRVLEINQLMPEASVRNAIPFLRERGIL